MLGSRTTLAARHGWRLVIVAGMLCFGASLTIMYPATANLLSFAPAQPTWAMLVLLGLTATGAFVIHRFASKID